MALNTALIVSDAQPFPSPPLAVGSITHLTINGPILFDHLLDDRLSAGLYLLCSDLKSLSITGLVQGAPRCTQQVLNRLFAFLQSLTKVDRLSVAGFTLAVPGSTSNLPTCLWNSPVSIVDVTITHTHGASLSFLLKCIRPHKLCLDACWFIEELPHCNELTLSNVQRFDGLGAVLSRWNGRRLTFKYSPFLDEAFIEDLRRRMEPAKNPIWRDAIVSYEGYTSFIEMKLIGLLECRSRFF